MRGRERHFQSVTETTALVNATKFEPDQTLRS